uniref:Uncharacterized protein n=1 Tax=Avena sativa TaxID=4498 RepID=A0ACD5XX77_AVESA
MTDGSDVSPEVAAAGGEIWGTLEELLLACAVSRHGTASWESVATEVQTRSPLAARPRLTPRSCRLRFHHLHRRFSVVAVGGGGGAEEEGHGEAEDLGASAADAWLDELRRLRVAELRREVERCDLSIGTLQSKVELMKEERERSLSGEAATKPEGNVTTGEEEENVSSEEPGRSCRESNSTDLKRPKQSGSVKEEASGESMAASKESSASLCRRGRKAGVGGGGEEECEEAASVQPLAALLDRVAARFGPVFERLQESQESDSYRATIRRHVDLDAMRRKLDDGSGFNYPSSELYRDLLLLCANAAVYLPRHVPEHAAAALDALRLVSAQVSASLRETTTTTTPHPQPKREPLLIGAVTAAALADSSSRRAEADIVGPLIAKAAKPLIFCRKRSSIAKAAAAAAVARKDETAEKKVAKEDSEGEKKKAGADVDVDVAAKDKAWGSRTKKTRGPGKNSAKALAKAAADEAAAAAATESDNNKKGDANDGTTAAAGGLPKKRIAVDFLKRLNQGTSTTTKKRGSPLTKRKRSAPAAQEEEEEQPKRRGPGRKSTGRGRGGKAAGSKRNVGRPPAKRGAAPATPPPAKRAKVERSSSTSRRGGRKS